MRKRDRELMGMFREILEDVLGEHLREERLLADRRHREFTAELQRQRDEMREHFAKQDRKIDEMVAEGKAGRAALFAMIDRLDRIDPGGGAATA